MSQFSAVANVTPQSSMPVDNYTNAVQVVYNIPAGALVIKPGQGRLVRFNVNVAGSQGTINDCATTGAAAAGNLVAVIPAVVGTYYLDWPCQTGIVVTPGAAQVISVAYY